MKTSIYKKRPNAQTQKVVEIEVVIENVQSKNSHGYLSSGRQDCLVLGELEAGRDTVGAGALLVEDASSLGRTGSSSHVLAGDIADLPAGLVGSARVGTRLAAAGGSVKGSSSSHGGNGSNGDGGELHVFGWLVCLGVWF
jgi:hypothetical protein